MTVVGPGGGPPPLPGEVDFTADVQPVLERRGCSLPIGCHGAPGGQRAYALTGEPLENFRQSRRFVNLPTPAASPLLTKPTQRSGVSHPVKLFGDPALSDDPDYALLLRWIEQGAGAGALAARDSLPPTVTVIPPDGADSVSQTPSLVISYTDDLAGVDTASLVILLNRVDRTSLFAVSPFSASYQVPEGAALPLGPNTLEASVADLRGNAAMALSRFTVISSGPATTVSFREDVEPVFQGQGPLPFGPACSNASCHGAGAGGFTLSGGTDPFADWQEAREEVNLDDPLTSLLVVRPSQGLPFHPLRIFSPPADTNYQVILRWIEEGALFN